MTRIAWMTISGTLMVLLSLSGWFSFVHASQPQLGPADITWADLLPKQTKEFDDPFASLNENLIAVFGLRGVLSF